MAAAAVAGIFGVVVNNNNNSNNSGSKSSATKNGVAVIVPEPKVDVSVPYDATFRQAYDAFRGNAEFNADQYEKFKVTYSAMMVAQVTAKKYLREYQRLEQELSTL
jgi:hypothetical protein